MFVALLCFVYQNDWKWRQDFQLLHLLICGPRRDYEIVVHSVPFPVIVSDKLGLMLPGVCAVSWNTLFLHNCSIPSKYLNHFNFIQSFFSVEQHTSHPIIPLLLLLLMQKSPRACVFRLEAINNMLNLTINWVRWRRTIFFCFFFKFWRDF